MSSAAINANLSSNIRGLRKTMRLRQWTKNAAVFAALIFDGKLLDAGLLLQTTLAMLCFCLASSSVYLLNDLVDIEKDRQHPTKRLRPLPAGELSPRLAMSASAFLAIVSILSALLIDLQAGLIVAAYLLLNIAYSFYLKNVVIIDVMMIALFFLLRVLVGIVVVDVSNFSPWLYVCVSLGALFLGFGKRRHEISMLANDAGKHRASLEGYNLPLLDQIMTIVTSTLLMAYTLYSFSAETAMAGKGRMLFSVPFVLYGIFRYLYLIHVKELGGAPDELALKDRHLLTSTLLWVLTIVALIYTK